MAHEIVKKENIIRVMDAADVIIDQLQELKVELANHDRTKKLPKELGKRAIGVNELLSLLYQINDR